MNFNESEIEDKKIEITLEVLLRHDYPDHEDVIEMIENIPEEFVEISEWLGEYSFENHECMERIWNNIVDRDLIQTMGEQINERGGFVSMQGCYYILLHVFRTLHKKQLNEPRVLIAWSKMKFLINVAWDGVGDWRM